MAKTRMTKQRKTILQVLKNTDSHPTADWIYDKVKKDIPNISLGTVYRNLNLLAEKGKIDVINYANDQSHYDGNTENHYHFRCQKCGNVYDLNIDLFEKEINKIVDNNTEFKVNTHRLEFYGVCPDCQ
ncbi:MAG TPA: transcriptional repressor [Halanaerobiales bacterium]|nr:transcriptional repressor [Halanaerobiales bacterium]